MGHAVAPLAHGGNDVISKRQEEYKQWEIVKRWGGDGEVSKSDESERFYHGEHWTKAELAVLAERHQAPTKNNQMRRKVEAMVGVARQSAGEVMAYGRNPGVDEASAKVSTQCLRYVSQNNDLETKEGDAFLRAEVRGIGGVRLRLLKDSKGQVEIVLEEVDTTRCFYDPSSKRPDFKDARYFGVWGYFDRDEVKRLFPDVNLADLSNADQFADTMFNANRFSGRVYKIIEHHYSVGNQWRVCYWSGDTLLLDRESLVFDDKGDTQPQLVLFSPYVRPDGLRYGDAADMVELQRALNKVESRILHLINSSQTMAEDGVVQDIEEMQTELRKPDGHVRINEGRMAQMQIINQSANIAHLLEVRRDLLQEFEAHGPNSELMGEAGASQSGIAQRQQQIAGKAKINLVLGRFRSWKLRVYRLMWGCIRKYWTDERIIRVTDDDKAPEYIHLNQRDGWDVKNSIAQIDVDIILDEGPSDIQRQESDFQQIMNILPALAANGEPLPPEIMIEMSQLTNKRKILERLEQSKQERQAKEQQAQQIQQQQMQQAQAGQNDPAQQAMQQIEMQAKQAEIEERRARAAKIMAEAQQLQNPAPTMPVQQEPDADDRYGPEKAMLAVERERISVERERLAMDIDRAKLAKAQADAEASQIDARRKQMDLNRAGVDVAKAHAGLDKLAAEAAMAQSKQENAEWLT